MPATASWLPAWDSCAASETVAARAAADPALGRPLAPPVLGVAAGRADLARLPGPRLDRLAAAAPAGLRPVLARSGVLLADLHRRPAPVYRAVPEQVLPWSPVPLEQWLGRSPAQRAVAAETVPDAALAKAAALAARRLAEPVSWLHGDARADNVCLDRRRRPLLVDWELTGLGRPELDLGALCASLVVVAVDGQPMSPGGGDTARAELRRGLGHARALTAPVLTGYRATAARRPDAVLLGAAVGLALLSAVYARCARLDLDRRNRTLLQLAITLVRDPAAWRTLDADDA